MAKFNLVQAATLPAGECRYCGEEREPGDLIRVEEGTGFLFCSMSCFEEDCPECEGCLEPDRTTTYRPETKSFLCCYCFEAWTLTTDPETGEHLPEFADDGEACEAAGTISERLRKESEAA